MTENMAEVANMHSVSSARFGSFTLDMRERQLRRDGVPVELNARYLDALALLVREPGKLVSKDRFLEEVWRGVPVTDEALTQCIKMLRRQLGDDAANPRFIKTVPKHGYRFIAALEGDVQATPVPKSPFDWPETVVLAGAGTIGGGMAGLIGGVIYGFAGASQPSQPGPGAVSVLLVLTCLTIVIALIGAAGVATGIATARQLFRQRWAIIPGGAIGGLFVGAVVKLLGLDAFNLLFGQSPGNITGASEGALLGTAVGVGAYLAKGGRESLRRSIAIAASCGGAAGIAIPLLGGQMMAGSLNLLAGQFPNSHLHLDQVGALFGEHGLGPIAQVFTGALEGSLFAACVVGAMALARRDLRSIS